MLGQRVWRVDLNHNADTFSKGSARKAAGRCRRDATSTANSAGHGGKKHPLPDPRPNAGKIAGSSANPQGSHRAPRCRSSTRRARLCGGLRSVARGSAMARSSISPGGFPGKIAPDPQPSRASRSAPAARRGRSTSRKRSRPGPMPSSGEGMVGVGGPGIIRTGLTTVKTMP